MEAAPAVAVVPMNITSDFNRTGISDSFINVFNVALWSL